MTTNSTTFTDYSTNVVSAWLNDVNRAVFTDVINVKNYGAVGDGTTDDSAAIAAAFAAGTNIFFPPGTYLITTGITKTADNINVDFGNAVFKLNFASSGTAFTFGTRADTPGSTGLRVRGGKFTLSNTATAIDNIAISVEGTKDFIISQVTILNACNGAIRVFAGCSDGVIERCYLSGKSGGATVRGIWLDGSSASDYASQLVNLSTITRNATALPVYCVKNVTIKDNYIAVSSYGLYLDNTQDCKVINNYIDIANSGTRCVAVNSYSPRTLIRGNTFRSTATATGVLVSQYSTGVIISDNEFVDTFGGGRDIYVQYLAEAIINNNRFTTDSTQRIQIDMGGIAIIQNNYFDVYTAYVANASVVNITTIDAAAASGTGDTATTLAGLVFKDNIVHNICAGVVFTTPTSTGGRIPGLDNLVVRDNTFYNMNSATTSSEYLITGTANGSTYVVKFTMFNNSVFPEDNAYRNTISVSGTGYSTIRSDTQSGTFRITNATGGGAITSAKQNGGYFSCAVSRSGDDALITPRTINGATNTVEARLISVIPVSTNIYSWKIFVSGSNYGIRVFDSAGTQILLSTTAATFDVVIAEVAT